MAFAKQPPGDGNRERVCKLRSLSSRFEWMQPGPAETKMLAFEAHNVGFLPTRVAKAQTVLAKRLPGERVGKGLRPLPSTPLYLCDGLGKKNRPSGSQNLLRG
jgi:hypothetical protein